jgi:hypothetical protein
MINNMLGFIVLILAIAGSLAWLWAGGIDYMHKNHPDYKGEDFLGLDEDEVNKKAGRDWWDDHLED